MCIYYGKTDFGGCYHSVKTEDIDQHLHIRKDFCSDYIQKWAKATINDDTAVLAPGDGIDPAVLALDGCNATAARASANIAPCVYRTYDSSAAVLASQSMSAVAATRSIAPVCPACAEKCREVDHEWDMIKLLVEKLNDNISHGLYKGFAPFLQDGRQVPAYIKVMIPISAERVQRMDERRSMAFAPDANTNVFATQQWDSLRFYQRLIFFEYMRRRPMLPWSTNITRFDRKVDADTWTYLNGQLYVLFVAQNMHHARAPTSDAERARGEATIDLDYRVQALAPPRDAAEIAGWANLHPRTRAEEAVTATDINGVSLFRPSVFSVLGEPRPNSNPATGHAEEAPNKTPFCIGGEDVFLGVEESEEEPSLCA